MIGKCFGRHRATEFLSFLKEIEATVPDELIASGDGQLPNMQDGKG